MMPLRIHCIKSYDGKYGTTECGEPFFVSRLSFPARGEFQSERRIGGLRAVAADKFEPTPEHCGRCVERWAL
ncbi:hypothetical protein EVB39_087 [Rhizobium phage RHph_TM3_3_9]|nr:hypothetical protein EVB39_087 [Rhizobium phage RHph_TM3_3_9]QIG68608.1 hypothetical protein EVB66_087 [Rhizobium phage RHph_TM3_3_13]QIG74466.1 hypothetical protein EVC09_086 [Rhizobium phage RHph_TM3_3_10]QXV74580.1 hypothetical protein [Rhizobium phage RHEph19]